MTGKAVVPGGADYLLSVDEVATWLGVPKRWVYERAQRGDLPSYRLGKYVRFRRQDVTAFIEASFTGSAR